MGFGNFLKNENSNKLPNNKLNESTIVNIFNNGAPFLVTLPINEIVRTKDGRGYSIRIGMFRHTIYNPPEYSTGPRRIYTQVKIQSEQLIIKHALSNGQHLFINASDIETIVKYIDGISIELHDGTQYIFSIDNHIINQWQSVGFNQEMILDVFMKLIAIPCPLCGKFINKNAERCKYCNVFLKNPQDKNKSQTSVQKYEKSKLNEFKKKDSSTNVNKIYEDPLTKIKEAKELLDMGALTDEEFKKIKNKYLKELTEKDVKENNNNELSPKNLKLTEKDVKENNNNELNPENLKKLKEIHNLIKNNSRLDDDVKERLLNQNIVNEEDMKNLSKNFSDEIMKSMGLYINKS